MIVPTLFILFCIFTLSLAVVSEGFSISFQTYVEHVPTTNAMSSAANYIDLNYNIEFKIALLNGITLTDTNLPKTLQLTLFGLFDLDKLPSAETGCDVKICGSSFCILHSLTQVEQDQLMENGKSLTISCNGFFHSIATGPNTSLTGLIIDAATSDEIYFNQPVVNIGNKFVQTLPAEPVSFTTPQIVSPNSDFTIDVTFTIENPPTNLATPDDELILSLYTAYSQDLTITTCRIKGNPSNPGMYSFDENNYASLGLEEISNTSIISFNIDPIFLLSISNSSPAVTVSFYCVLHAPLTDTTASDPVISLVHVNTQTSTLSPVYLSPIYLPDITFTSYGLRFDFRMENLQQWLLNEAQLNKMISVLEKLLSETTNLYLKQFNPQSQPSVISIQKTKYQCNVMTFERQFDKSIPYPGSTQGVYNVLSLNIYCFLVNSSSPIALAYADQLYLQSISNIWNFKEMLTSTISWQFAYILDNIDIPPPEEEGDMGDNAGDFDQNDDGDDSLVNESDLDPDTPHNGPILYQNGTIYDTRIISGDYTVLQLYRIGAESLPTHCFNNEIDTADGEVGVDCGGPCKLCSSGQKCNSIGEQHNGGCLFECDLTGICSDSHAFFASTHYTIVCLIFGTVLSLFF